MVRKKGGALMADKIPVWIDTDCGIDDALALLAAMKMDALDIAGVSAVSGNVGLEHTFPNTRNVIAFAGYAHTVFKGASKPLIKQKIEAAAVHGANGLGGVVLAESAAPVEQCSAIDALYKTAAVHPRKLVIVTIGPLTTIAQALFVYPDLKDRIKQIVCMGGGVERGNVSPKAEFNFFADPHAAQIICKSGIPLVMCGLDVTMQAFLTEQELAAKKGRNKIYDFVIESSKTIIDFYGTMYGKRMLVMHDTTPFMYLSHPDMFTGAECGVFVETRSRRCEGWSVCDLYTDAKFGVKNAFVLTGCNRESFRNAVFALLDRY